MKNGTSSTPQRSLWQQAGRWLKSVLCNPSVFRWCLLAFRVSEEIRHWFSGPR